MKVCGHSRRINTTDESKKGMAKR